MLFEIGNLGLHIQMLHYKQLIKDLGIDVITKNEVEVWASEVAGCEVTAQNTYVALFGAGDIIKIQQAVGKPLVVDSSPKPRIRIMDRN